MNEVNEVVDALIVANLDLIFVLIGAVLLPILVYAITKIGNSAYKEFIEFKNSQPEVVQAILDQAVGIAYRFVEQKTKDLDLENTDKLELAVVKANEWLKVFNYDLPKDIIVTNLEKFIYEIHENGVSKLDIVKDMSKEE